MSRNQHVAKKRVNVTTFIHQISNIGTLCGESLETMAMSRHQLEKGSIDSLNVATTKQCHDISQSLNTADYHIQCRDIIIRNVATFTQGNHIGETSQNVATLNKCRDISQKYW